MLPETRQTTPEDKWEALKPQRPKLIVEVASADVGVGITDRQTIREFQSGRYQNCRYLCIDPALRRATDSQMYYRGIQKPIEDPTVAEEYQNQASEVWMRNIGSIAQKPHWFRAIHRILQDEGSVIIVDIYTKGLYQEREEFMRMFEEIGFIVEDYTLIQNEEISDHPFVQGSLRNRMSGDFPVILRLKKRS